MNKNLFINGVVSAEIQFVYLNLHCVWGSGHSFFNMKI